VSSETRLHRLPDGRRLAYAGFGDPGQDIACPRVMVWHGARDRNVPIAMARYVAQAIRGCRATFYPDEGHYSLPLRHMTDIVRALTVR
jgi:pimeloyl-ACP methyl ester carboxylesterase